MLQPLTAGIVVPILIVFLIALYFAVTSQRFRLGVDKISTVVGQGAGWLIVVLTFATSYEVMSRYVFGKPTSWAFDASYILYGSLFMLAGPYALARNGHVRGDFLYREWSVKAQARWDLALYFLFFFPGIFALMYAGFGFAKFAWMIGERSSNSPDGPPLYHFKSLIPIVGAMMALQGTVEVGRCIDALRTGQWPERLNDVEETEKRILEEAEANAARQGSV